MDARAVDVAFCAHMQRARSKDLVDPDEAAEERRHALELAETWGQPRHVVEACGALCWSETALFGAPLTERYLRRGLESATGLYVPQFLEFEGLYAMEERGDLDGAERCFEEGLALDAPNQASLHAGLGMVLLRMGRFEEARRQFRSSLGVIGPDGADLVGKLRALDGQAEAERHLGADRAAAASASRMLELTSEGGRSRTLRRYRSRALNGLGLVRWRAGDDGEALRSFRRVLELWPDVEERQREAEAFVALERHQALRHAKEQAAAPPVEPSPGCRWAVGFLRLGREALTPVELDESPLSAARLERLVGLRSGDAFELALRPALSTQVGRAWFVSRVRVLRAERCVIVDLVPDESSQ